MKCLTCARNPGKVFINGYELKCPSCGGTGEYHPKETVK